MALSRRKNDEAPTTCDSQGLLSKKSSDGHIDMNIVHNNELTFQNISFSYMEMAGQIWLTASEVGQALEYADDKAIHRIFNRHADAFTSQMTGVVKVTTPGGMQDMRVFSLRGAHLIGMFARTPKAKEFRRWVLDVLDREVANGSVSPAFNFEMHAHNAKVALDYAEFIYQHWCEEIRPSLSLVGSPLANSLNERIKVLASITYGLNSGLAKAAKEKGMIH